ncbi:unknown [Prevotella sp. CAG:1185]|nr:unknown [Prevotella sp. CAG:1185]
MIKAIKWEKTDIMGHADGNKRDRRFAGTEIYFVKKQENARVKKAKHTALITAFGTMKP